MNPVILEVIPIARGIGKETLSYFSASDVPAGSVVKVPLRNKQISALVISSKPADEMRGELRSADYALRKANSAKSVKLFLPEFIAAAEETARYFAGTTGGVLASLTSKPFFEMVLSLKTPIHTESPTPTAEEKTTQEKSSPTAPSQETKKEAITQEPFALQADEEGRLAHYKSHIRGEFARKRSVFFCLPTIQDTKRIWETVPKGIEEYTVVLHSSLSKKELTIAWEKIMTETHPILVIGTGAFLGLPRTDLGSIIIERESSGSYKSKSRPFTDVRTFAEFLAKRLKATLIFGDLLLRIETLWRIRNNEITEFASFKFRSLSSAETTLVDMKKYKTLEKPEFRIIGEELEQLITTTKANNGHMFIFAARRGLSPTTVCGDCGAAVLCSRCSAPIILHASRRAEADRGRDENFFLCHRCGERRSAAERCRICNSWRLTTLGIGIELVRTALEGMFPEVKLFVLDKDTAKTHTQATTIARQFYNAPGSVLLGTEMALLYLERPIDSAAIASIDSLFSLPDFRINEKVMNILLRIRSLARVKFVIQTRSRQEELFKRAANGNITDFYREEIEARKRLNYPPFSLLIKISTSGSKSEAAHEMEKIATDFSEYEPVIFPAFIETVDGKHVMNALIRIPREKWVSPLLLAKLQSLPLSVSVNVDPENLL